MSIDKGLYQAPKGLEQLTQNEPDIEIEIEDPEGVKIGVDGEPILEIDKDEEDDDFNANLAEEMDKGTLRDPVVVEKAKDFLMLKVDLTSKDSPLWHDFNIRGVPTYVFLDANGREHAELRLTPLLQPPSGS